MAKTVEDLEYELEELEEEIQEKAKTEEDIEYLLIQKSELAEEIENKLNSVYYIGYERTVHDTWLSTRL